MFAILENMEGDDNIDKYEWKMGRR
jgi:hypothetical protein